MSRTWHEYMPLHSTEPTTHQALAPSSPIRLLYKLISVTDVFIFSASAKAWRQRQIKVAVSVSGPYRQNLTSEMLKANDIQWRNSSDIPSSFRSFSNIQHPQICWQLNSIRDEWWNYSTSKPSKLLTVKGCRKHDIMTCRSIQRFCGAHPTHQALPPPAPIVHRISMFVTDAFILSASAKSWRQRQIKAFSQKAVWIETWP